VPRLREVAAFSGTCVLETGLVDAFVRRRLDSIQRDA
jgi:hypothetical protein